MYSKFDVKKDKELIILNYYIETNLDGVVFSKSIREIANALDINKNRVQKLMIELQEKGVIEKINSSCKSKGAYLYKDKQNISVDYRTDFDTDFETEKSCKNKEFDDFIGTDFRTDLSTDLNINKKSNEYKNVIKEVFKDNIDELQIDLMLEIQGLETIELELFESILKESTLRASKNPVSYAHKMIMNTIKDNITTLKDRENSQKKRIEDNDRNNNYRDKKIWNYMDSSENDDFERLAKLTRNR